MYKAILLTCLQYAIVFSAVGQSDPAPVKVGVMGLTHTHVHWTLGREPAGDIEIVGIVEPNRELAQRYATQHGYTMNPVFNTNDLSMHISTGYDTYNETKERPSPLNDPFSLLATVIRGNHSLSLVAFLQQKITLKWFKYLMQERKEQKQVNKLNYK